MRGRLRQWAMVFGPVFLAIAGWPGCSSLLGIPGDVGLSTDSGLDGEDGAVGDGSAVDGRETGSEDAGVEARDARNGVDAEDAIAALLFDATDATGDVEAGGSPLVLENVFTASLDWQPPDAGPTILATQISTTGPNRLLVAVVVWAADHTDVTPVNVSGAGLSWSGPILYRTFPVGGSGGVQPGGAGVAMWTTVATSAIPINPTQTVTATRQPVDSCTFTLGVYAFYGYSSAKFGASGSVGDDNGGNYPLNVTLDARAAGSFVVGGFVGGVSGYLDPAAPTQWDKTDNPGNTPFNHFTAVGRLQTQAPGSITMGANYLGDFNVAAAMEILPGP